MRGKRKRHRGVSQRRKHELCGRYIGVGTTCLGSSNPLINRAKPDSTFCDACDSYKQRVHATRKEQRRKQNQPD